MARPGFNPCLSLPSSSPYPLPHRPFPIIAPQHFIAPIRLQTRGQHIPSFLPALALHPDLHNVRPFSHSSSPNCHPPTFSSPSLTSGSCFRMHFRSLEEFWPFYMNQHTKASTRRWHFCATLAATVFLVAALLIKWWLFFFAPLFGCGLAWYSHFFIEGNSPASFGHPVWSFMCDCKMFGLMLTGRMDREIKRLGKRPIIQVS